MKLVDVLILAILLLILLLAFGIKKIRRKKGKSCCDCGSFCGNCDKCK